MAALVGDAPLIVVAGPTGSGKTALAMRLAERFGGEIVSCDSVAVYRGMDVGTAKATGADRARVRHHLVDVVEPSEAFTAGEYSRLGRLALAEATARRRVPIVAGGTGLYLRALLEGLFPAPETGPAMRERLRARSSAHLHRVLERLDARAAGLIHAHDKPKLVRAVEVSLAARRPMSEQWAEGREALTGFRVLRLGLQPDRAELYRRIDARVVGMFAGGLVEETRGLLARYGAQRALESLGYREAGAVLRGKMTVEDAVRRVQQGHRNYAKRQGTWFRRESGFVWLEGFGDDGRVVENGEAMLRDFLAASGDGDCAGNQPRAEGSGAA